MEDDDGIPDDTRSGSGQKPYPDTGAKSKPDDDTLIDTAAGEAPPRPAAIRFIGTYRLLRKLGEGGMGQVWLAEQSEPLQRRVALKLVKTGMCDDSLLQRFLAERQSLAIMNHPCIAKVFDAGATSEGQPYFVMEYVPGQPVTTYCDQKCLTLDQRLSLFTKLCEGVQHAHQKAIIHRDLKPANILVIEVDGQPTPRIIDFGLAKSASPQNAGESLHTQFGGFVGTRGFMSPEQTDPTLGDVDTRSDVYSLGVVLYLLLTGSLPFDPDEWKKRPIDEVLRQLREEDPPSPSAKISSLPATQSAIAKARSTQPRQLVSALIGDLDWITAKALEKDRSRRYGTPSELAADIQRYLNNQPVLARPASSGYRLQKYVRRHRIAVSVASGFLILLVGFAVMQFLQLRRVTRERDRANRITDFMTGMFKVSDPSEARGNTITAREILDKASMEIDRGLAKDPEMQAQMMYAMGRVYYSLGLYSRALSLLERTVSIRERTLGPNDPQTLRSLDTLASCLADDGRYAEAEQQERKILAIRQRILGPKHPDTLVSMNDLAATLGEEGKYPESERLHRETLDLRRRVLGPDDKETLTSMYNVAWVLEREGHYPEAEVLDRETLQKRQRVLGSDHPQTLASMGQVAIDLKSQGKFDEAESLERDTLAARRRVLGPEHPETLMSMSNLAIDLRLEGKYAESETLGRQTLEIEQRALGLDHPTTIKTMINLAIALEQQGRYAEAEEMDRKTLVIERRVLGAEHPDTLNSMNNLAIDLKLQNRYVDAEKLYRETLDIRRRVLGPEHPSTLATMINLATCLLGEHRYSDAERLYREALGIERRVLKPDHAYIAVTELDLAEALAREEKRDQALSELRQAVDGRLDAETLRDIEKDADLESLHGDPRFVAIIADAKRRAGAAREAN